MNNGSVIMSAAQTLRSERLLIRVTKAFSNT